MFTWLRNVLYVYLCLLLVPSADFGFGPLKQLLRFYHSLFDPLVDIVGKYVFGIPTIIRYAENGSGDSLYNWVLQFTLILLSGVIGGILSAVWKDRPYRSRFRHWLYLLVAISLSCYMLIYGLAKVFDLQFPRPSLVAMYQSYGRSSPMHLLWTFMGYSRPYVLFTGALEVAAGLLLLPRATRTVGALMTLGIMTHVLMLNLSYDVPVKLFSAQLIFYALVLVGIDRERLWNFVRNRPVGPQPVVPLTRSVIGRQLILGGKLSIVVLFTAGAVFAGYRGMEPLRQRSPLYGIYEVEEFKEDGKALTVAAGSATPWKRIIFEHPDYAAVMVEDKRAVLHPYFIDTSTQTLQLNQPSSNEVYMALHYEIVDKGLQLNGRVGTLPISIRTRRVDETTFSISRGLHWVSEEPYNRYE